MNQAVLAQAAEVAGLVFGNRLAGVDPLRSSVEGELGVPTLANAPTSCYILTFPDEF
jgi:hypothetical protein